MIKQPKILSDRLILRPFKLADATVVQRLAGDKIIADTTIRIPHPYRNGIAEQWIKCHKKEFKEKKSVNFAIVKRKSNKLVGAIGLTLNKDNENAELGYWIGKPYWGNGYATEAAGMVLMYGFTELQLNRIHAHHFTRNLASKIVLEKIGMKREGCLRQHIRKWSVFEDIQMYGILKEEYQSV